jgi:two-component system, OmpR family, sensor kinase
VNLHSLRFKLIWIHGAAIALVVFCVGLVRYQIISYRSRTSFDEALLRDGQLFTSRLQLGHDGFSWIPDGLSTGDILAVQGFEPYFVTTNLQGKVLRAELYNQVIRTMLERKDVQSALQKHSGFTDVESADRSTYRFVHLPLPPGIFREAAVIHIGRSMEPLKRILNEYLVFYFYSVPLVLMISVGVGWFLAGRAMRPFEEITRTAEKINYENLNTQIDTRHKEEEVQRLVQSFNAMVQRLNESFQQMRKFNADAAHELRTPLAIIQGETEIALRSPNLSEEIRSVLASNLEELDRLTHLVNELLTLAEAEAGRQVLSKKPVDLKLLVEDLVEQMRLLATDRSVRIELGSMPELWIDADELWIRRALINLLDNAIKYSKAGGIVEVSYRMEGPMVRLSIKDYGIGISRDDLPYIFNRLYRSDPARNRVSGGVGLGLALVKWIVEAHKGSIQVLSNPELGSCFQIILPASAAGNQQLAFGTRQ